MILFNKLIDILKKDEKTWTKFQKVFIEKEISSKTVLLQEGEIANNIYIINRQVLILTFLFVLVAVTGLTPWLIDLLKGDQMLRKVFIEIHDKLAIILTVFLILHSIKRMKWIFSL